jgi:hypothetical protein
MASAATKPVSELRFAAIEARGMISKDGGKSWYHEPEKFATRRTN